MLDYLLTLLLACCCCILICENYDLRRKRREIARKHHSYQSNKYESGNKEDEANAKHALRLNTKTNEITI